MVVLRISDKLADFLFCVIVFFLTRQVPFFRLSWIMNLCVLILVGFALNIICRRRVSLKIFLIFLLLPLCFSLVYSVLIEHNTISLAFRFFLILLSISLAYHLKISKNALRWFILLCLLQAVFIVLFSFYLSIFHTLESYLPIRSFIIRSEWGDVYTYDGLFYRVQLKGNALLPVAYVLNREFLLMKRRGITSLILIVGVIIAGNFAYLIAIFLYTLYRTIRPISLRNLRSYLLRISLVVFSGILLSPILISFVLTNLERKQEDSLGTRWDQASLLWSNLNENLFTTLLGRGLGNTLSIQNSFRDYTDNVYFELQFVYVLNQLGWIFMILFLLYNIYMVFTWRCFANYSVAILIYITYVTYAVTNPYIFDTNHFIVIVILSSIVGKEGFCIDKVR